MSLWYHLGKVTIASEKESPKTCANCKPAIAIETSNLWYTRPANWLAGLRFINCRNCESGIRNHIRSYHSYASTSLLMVLVFFQFLFKGCCYPASHHTIPSPKKLYTKNTCSSSSLQNLNQWMFYHLLYRQRTNATAFPNVPSSHLHQETHASIHLGKKKIHTTKMSMIGFLKNL